MTAWARVAIGIPTLGMTGCHRVHIEPVGGGVGPLLAPAKARGPIVLHFIHPFLRVNERVRVILDLGAAFKSGDTVGVLLVSSETRDVELLVMRHTRGSTFRDTSESIVRMKAGGTVTQLDGTRTAKPGERVIALFYPDRARHVATQATIASDIAIFETAEGRLTPNCNSGLADVVVDGRLAKVDRADAGQGS